MAIILFIILAVAGICIYDFIDGKNWQNATSTSRNLVIFANRNKKYGAYHLRSDYNDSLGMIIGIFAFAMILVSVVNANIRTIPPKIQLRETDPVLLDITAPPVEQAEIIRTTYRLGGSAGAGSPSNDPVIHRPMKQTQAASELPSETTSAGQSNKTNGENADNKPSSMLISSNPFGTGGATTGLFSGIKGTKDNGEELDGDYRSRGAIKRKQLTRLEGGDIQSNTACVIELKVFINAAGKVVDAKSNADKTNTTEKTLVSKVIQLVKEQIRYEEKPGAAIQVQTLSVKVSAR